MAAVAPKLPAESKRRINHLSEQFKVNLKDVAKAFAIHENAETVLVRHVDEAHTALARLGLTICRWYERSELLTGLGGLTLGLAFAAPDILGAFLDDSPKRHGITIGVVVAMFAIGLFRYGFGWVRGMYGRRSK
ncbi:MAG TPA: hypothetical protein VK137_06570 [Planctomycetaceae bacterium]|nr:hypothetical protein [Planctomycetaceae bacterium]